MVDANATRQLATSIVEALKHEGHILVGKGAGETVLRELSTLIQPVLTKVMPSVLRAEVHGEVTSTFGDEATDEAIEELVEALREALIESDGVEDVFADDKIIERLIFRTLREGLIALAATADEEAESQPPISVRLHTLGYVAATAARLSDEDTVRDALERAALAASTELDTFDPATRTAIFSAREDDPDKRLEIEEAVEEELADLVDMGFVDLPRVERTVELPFPLNDVQRKSLTKRVNAIADAKLANPSCPSAWEWRGEREIRLGFTPMSEPDGAVVDSLTAAFSSAVVDMLVEARSAAMLRRALNGQDGAPASARGAEGGPSSARSSTPADDGPLSAASPASGAPPSEKSAAHKSAAHKSAANKSAGPASSRAAEAPPSSKTARATTKEPAKKASAKEPVKKELPKKESAKEPAKAPAKKSAPAKAAKAPTKAAKR